MNLYTAILIALNSLPIYKEDLGNLEAKRAQLVDHSLAIHSSVRELAPLWPGSPEELAAVTVTIGYAESGYSLRVQRDECFAWECDGGRARGTYQMHVDAVQGRDPTIWIALPGLDVGSVELSADQVVRAVIRARRQCGSLERAGKDWVPITFHAYARSTCVGTFKGLSDRVSTYQRVLGKILQARGYHGSNPNEVLEVSMGR